MHIMNMCTHMINSKARYGKSVPPKMSRIDQLELCVHVFFQQCYFVDVYEGMESMDNTKINKKVFLQ
jgi:hypothetical protein